MENPSTTVVGSWPLSNTNENMERVFNDLIQIGIDFPCYPQLTSMISQFLSPLTEEITPLEEINNKFFLSNGFKIPKNPIALEYGRFIKSFFNKRPELLKQIKGTKACLTGPITLASEIILKGEVANGLKARIFTEPRAIMVDWIVEKIADIMKNVGKEYNKMGIDIISMDEPLLGVLIGRKVLFHSEDFILEILNKSISEIKSLSSIHVCGRISPKCRDILLQTNARILDHEFRTNEENLEIFQKEHLTNNDKILALGTVKSKFLPVEGLEINDYVEGIDSLERYLRKAIIQYGKENLMIKPDCGFGATKNVFKDENFAYEIALRKVKNMVKALKNIK
jgi:methionine synthase II (cobalamin-independent)